MPFKCFFGFHAWEGCKCSNSQCGKVRDEGHAWEGCTCSKCSKVRGEEHSWEGCKCSRCGKARDERHSWEGCKCSECGKEGHIWEYCRCTKCGTHRRRCHDWATGEDEKYDVCIICGETQPLTRWDDPTSPSEFQDYLDRSQNEQT
jgi:hypothetical protein